VAYEDEMRAAALGGVLEDSTEDLYEHAPCAYLSTLPSGVIVKVNATFLAWTGHRREDLVGRRRFQDLLTAGGRIYHETHYAPLLQMQGAVREIALEVVCADGRRLPVLVNSVLRRDAAGAPLLVRTTVFDATDRKKYERELLLARNRERSAREHNERLQRITAALAAPLGEQDVAATAVRELLGSTGADRAVLAVLDEDDGAPRVLHRHGPDPDGADRAEPRGAPAFVEEAGGGRALAALPLLYGGRSIGILELGFGAAPRFDEDERAFMLACAAQCAQALERARLYERTREAARRMALLAESGRVLDEVQGFRARAQRLVDLLARDVADGARFQAPGDEDGTPVAVVAGDVPPEQGSEAQALDPAQAMATPEPRLVAAEDTAPGPGRSSVALPVGARGRVLGVLTLTRRDPGRPFRAADLPFLRDVADRAGVALENARLYEHQRDVALTLQRSLLSLDPPRDERFAVATHYQPGVRMLEVGGDWYDTFPIDDDRIGLVVGDVVGRGIDAATAMGQLRSALRALAVADLGPARLIEHLDRFVAHVDAASHATLAYAELALDNGLLRFACAGHMPPLLAQAGEAPRLLWDGRSAPLGAYLASTFPSRPEAEVTLRPGARMLLYTDGLVESRARPIDDGLDLLVAEFARRPDAPVSELVAALPGALLEPQSNDDDVCLLALAFGSPR
jgi:serine/threonine-protein kinase RsbW